MKAYLQYFVSKTYTNVEHHNLASRNPERDLERDPERDPFTVMIQEPVTPIQFFCHH